MNTCPQHAWNLPCVRCLFDTRNRIEHWWALGGVGLYTDQKRITIKTKRRQLILAPRQEL